MDIRDKEIKKSWTFDILRLLIDQGDNKRNAMQNGIKSILETMNSQQNQNIFAFD